MTGRAVDVFMFVMALVLGVIAIGVFGVTLNALMVLADVGVDFVCRALRRIFRRNLKKIGGQE